MGNMNEREDPRVTPVLLITRRKGLQMGQTLWPPLQTTLEATTLEATEQPGHQLVHIRQLIVSEGV